MGIARIAAMEWRRRQAQDRHEFVGARFLVRFAGAIGEQTATRAFPAFAFAFTNRFEDADVQFAGVLHHFTVVRDHYNRLAVFAGQTPQ